MQYNTLAFKIQMLDMLSIIVSCHEFLIKVIKRTYVNKIHIWVRAKGGIFQRRHQSGPGEVCKFWMTNFLVKIDIFNFKKSAFVFKIFKNR